MSWRFEGSNDMVNWTLLDTRYHKLHNDVAIGALSQPGGASTWGIDDKLFGRYGTEGFSCFRVVQIDANSSGDHKLSLSGVELYGIPTTPETWQF